MTMTHYPPSLNDGSNVFVFGSNQAGRHGKGAAREAMLHWGAIYGQGIGRQGQSYAIPTKGFNLETLCLLDIEPLVSMFLDYARANPGTHFLVTRIGCGLAGYGDSDIGPLFKDAPTNCTLPREWGGS